MRDNRNLAISRIVLVAIIVVILAIAGGAAYLASVNMSSTTTSMSSRKTSSSSSSITTSSSTLQSSSTYYTSSQVASSAITTSTTSQSSASCPSSSTATAKTSSSLVSLNIGLPAPAIQLAPAAIAQSLGIYANYGLDVSYAFSNTNIESAALDGGSMQFASFTVSTWFHSGSASNFVAVAGNSPKGSPFYLMVNPSITSPQQLIGKTVAVLTPPGTPTEFALIYILGALGLNESQVKVSFLLNPNLDLSALLAGTVAAAVVSPPRNIMAASNGFKQLGPVSTATADVAPDFFLTTRNFLANNPDTVRSFLMGALVAEHDIAVAADVASGINVSTTGVNVTAVVAALSSFLRFNTTLTEQSLQIYRSENLLNPTMQQVNSTTQESYYELLSLDPALANLNLTSMTDYSIIHQLNAKCGFVYDLWGGSPPTALP